MPSKLTAPAKRKLRQTAGKSPPASPAVRATADAAAARVAAIRSLRRELRSLAAQIRSGEPIPPLTL